MGGIREEFFLMKEKRAEVDRARREQAARLRQAGATPSRAASRLGYSGAFAAPRGQALAAILTVRAGRRTGR